MCDKMHKIVAEKNHDYSSFIPDDAFCNFKIPEFTGIASDEVGFLVRMQDKMSRINSFVKQGVLKVENEKIEDTLLDLANYCILMAGYIKAKQSTTKP